MSRERFRSRPGAFAEAVGLLRRIHASGVTFDSRFDVFALIAKYRAIVAWQKPLRNGSDCPVTFLFEARCERARTLLQSFEANRLIECGVCGE